MLSGVKKLVDNIFPYYYEQLSLRNACGSENTHAILLVGY